MAQGIGGEASMQFRLNIRRRKNFISFEGLNTRKSHEKSSEGKGRNNQLFTIVPFFRKNGIRKNGAKSRRGRLKWCCRVAVYSTI